MSLSTPYDPTNIFAKIIKGEMPSVKVFENDDVLSFMDVFPQTTGHTLVIPKNAEAVNFFDIPPDALQSLIVHTQTIAKAVKTALNPDGIRIIQFNGDAAGQTVFHLHFHILPVYRDTRLTPHASGKPVDTAELETTAELIRKKLHP
ncbi:MAG: HIT family protein [Pseudomonadota bacterium]